MYICIYNILYMYECTWRFFLYALFFYSGETESKQLERDESNSKEMRLTRKRWEQREKDKINYYLLRCINCKRKRGIYFCHVHSLTSHVSYIRTHLMSLTWEQLSNEGGFIFVMYILLFLSCYISCLLHENNYHLLRCIYLWSKEFTW